MKIMSSSAAKRAFGKFLGAARREPVIVTRRGRQVGVFLSASHLEDMIWGERALAAHREGYLGPRKSRKLIASLLTAAG